MRRRNYMTLYIRHIISHIGTATNKLRRTLSFLFLITVLGTGTLKSQETGLYYIVNNNNNAFNPFDPTTNWYLVPASNGGDANVDIATWTWNNNANTPLLTTYQTKKDINSIWVVEETGDYYHLIHVLTNKYMTLNTGVGSNSNRRTFHMEAPATLGDNHLFSFKSHAGTPEFYSINPKTKTSGHMYLNPSNGNKPTYYASATTDGVYYVGGTLGLYNKDATQEQGSKWYLEGNALLPAPSINYDSENNTFTISYDRIPSGDDITYLYTINDDTPEIGGSTTNVFTTSVPVSGTYTVKAVVVRYGLVLTQIASKLVGTPPAPTITLPNDCENMVEMTSADGCPIYYTLDGSAPDQNSILYSVPIALNENVTINAVAYNGTISSATTTLDYNPPYSAKPTITRNGITITINGTGTIYYTTDGSDPTTGSTPYNDPIILNDNGSGGTMTIKAVAKDGTKEVSCVAEKTINLGYFINNLQKLEGITSHLNEKCIVTNDIDVSDLSSSISGFTGEFDGGHYIISGLKKPLFTNLNGGTVKNVRLSEVNITSGTNVGAICDEAYGTTKIYNCGVLSGSVNGSGNVGGLVGLIKSGSSVRVVNCYNFSQVSGGTTMAGIVGNNQGTVGDVRIALCMMYGKMSNSTSPVYAGNHTSNVKNYTEYNYWRTKAPLTYSTYNDQLAIDKDEYLTRFPFYRHILNTHRELAAFFLFGESGESVNDITDAEISEIGHWVLDKSVAPYPIVEEWKTDTKRTIVDIAANLPSTTDDRKGKLLTEMGRSGYLTLNVNINDSKYIVQLPITDMNEDNYDYTWGKVVLPFANEFSGWTRDWSKVCTGWEITHITGGTEGSFAHYDVADRDYTAKDLYDNSDYIFAQGGNYIVPYSVTSIDITAHFANAFYLSDPAYEIGYDANFGNATPLGGNVPNVFHGRTVYTSLSTLVSALAETTNPHDQAIVLVGNYHYRVTAAANVIFSTSKAVTIMSADEDNNQEPDYGWYQGNTYGRLEVPPLRFDFVPNIEMGMSSRVGSSLYPGLGIWHTRGWFELTETCVSNMSQCEINSDNFTYSDNGKGNNRWIANSGCFVQIVRARDGNCIKLSYIQIGGNAYVKELYPGCHTDNARTNTAVPIAVTGGQVDECYMTGYKAGGKLNGDIYFWCAGGKIGKFLGAYLEEPVASNGTGGITAKVDHALIGRFFGGGTSGAARIKGNIDITINNSEVDFYCGGPEFGNMEANKTVTTHATGTTFGEYYGAGFGGTSITYNREAQTNNFDITSTPQTTYDLAFSNYKRLTKNNTYGIGSCYKFEYIFHSNGSNGVTRFYTGYAQFDLATTGNVTNILNNCKIKKLPGTNSLVTKPTSGDFYGAGCQGKVNGTVTSTLTNCTVEGSAFGGGYKAESNEVDVYPATQPTYSQYTKETGIFSDFGTVAPETYEWVQGDNSHDGIVGTGANAGKLFTSKSITMSDLGNVTGAISLTLDGCTIGDDDDTDPNHGNVYGGGNESKSLNNATVTLKGDSHIYGNVFGGGNKAIVSGITTVNIED